MLYEEWKNRILKSFPDAAVETAGDKHWGTVHFPDESQWNHPDLRVRGQTHLMPHSSGKQLFVPCSVWTIEDDYWRSNLTVWTTPEFASFRSSLFKEFSEELGETCFLDAKNRHIRNVDAVTAALKACFKPEEIDFKEEDDEYASFGTNESKAKIEQWINPNVPNAEEFGLSESGRLKGYPWMITLNQVESESSRITFANLGMFCVSIREQQTGKLICDYADVPTDIPRECANILEQAVAYCRNCGPDGSDWNRVCLWNDDAKLLYKLQCVSTEEKKCAHFDSKELMNTLLRIQVNPFEKMR